MTIKNLEFAIADKGIESGWLKPVKPSARTNRKIAIVGSGPAGLSVAQQLNSVGHNVEVYERADRIGGLMMYGHPKHETRQIYNRYACIEIAEQEGIKFHTNTNIGGHDKDSISMEELIEDNDIVLLTTGATKPRDLPIENREGAGVYFAMEF